MKTDQIVAHGHAVIKQLLAYMAKSEPSLLALPLSIDAHPLVFGFFCHKQTYVCSLFIHPSLLTICVV